MVGDIEIHPASGALETAGGEVGLTRVGEEVAEFERTGAQEDGTSEVSQERTVGSGKEEGG